MVENELYHGSMYMVMGVAGVEYFKATADLGTRTVTGVAPDGWWVRPGASPLLPALDGKGWLGPFATAAEARTHFKYP